MGILSPTHSSHLLLHHGASLGELALSGLEGVIVIGVVTMAAAP